MSEAPSLPPRTRPARATKVDLLAEVERLGRLNESLRSDLDYAERKYEDLRRQIDEQVSNERERIMQDALRRHAKGERDQRWVVATRRLVCDAEEEGVFGVLHVRDAMQAPRIVKPTVRLRGRYMNGETREAGPGSHVGLALCGLPFMAEQLWVVADRLLKFNSNGYELCGMCSYLSGQPTIEAAREALRK